MNKEKLAQIVENIKNEESYNNEYSYYGVRYHHNNNTIIDKSVSESYEWVDGDITDEMLNGTCALDIRDMIDNDYTIDEIIESVEEYSYENGEIIIIAGNNMEYGNDKYEIIIHDAVRVV